MPSLISYGCGNPVVQEKRKSKGRGVLRPAPVAFKKTGHRFGKTFMLKDQRRPGWFGQYRVQQCHQTAPAIKQGQFQRQAVEKPDLDSTIPVFIQTILMFRINRAGFDQQPSVNAASRCLFHQLFVQGIDRKRRA